MWSNWEETALGRYRSNNSNINSVGRNPSGLPNPPSVPTLPTSSNCNYTVYGIWHVIDGDNKFYGGFITVLYAQRMQGEQILYSYSVGFPKYFQGRYASFDGVERIDTSREYGNQDMRCALGTVKHTVYPNQKPFLYGNWHKDLNLEIVFVSIFAEGLVNCDFLFAPVDNTPRLHLGTAAPPPPPPPDMNCCDCNTISTILAEQIIAEAKQHEATRELIDRRTIEGLREINKMLQGMQINLNLQPIIDRLNELEANLWNGLKTGG